MQPAPAVSFECDDGGAWRAVQALLAALTAAVLARWVAGWADLHALLGTVVASTAGLGVFALEWRRHRTPELHLAWDGHRWLLRADAKAAVAGQVQVAIDLGVWMLLVFRAEVRDRARWLAVGSAAGSAARAALHASGRAGREPAALPRDG